jgi:ribose transport system substrate-binding protein
MTGLSRFVYGICAVAVAVALAACGSSSSSSAGTAKTSGHGTAQGKTVYLLSLTRSCDTCATFADEANAVFKKAGVKVITEYVNFGDAATQTQQFNQALSTNPAAIVVWPTDTTSLIPALARAKQDAPSVKVVIGVYPPQTSDTSLYAAYFGVDEKQLGVDQAESMVAGIKALKKSLVGSVLEVTGAPGAYTTTARQQGFDAELAKAAPGLKIVDTQTANWDETQATTVGGQMFAKYGGASLRGVFAESDVMLNGVILAGQRAGYKAGKNYVAVGIDCDPIGYSNIKALKEYSTVLWNPVEIGQKGADLTISLLEGKTVPKQTLVSAPEITPTNTSECLGATVK